jgi:hypothetical protein
VTACGDVDKKAASRDAEARIGVRLGEPNPLVNTMNPAPLRELDPDPKAEELIRPIHLR